jgi:hypothetical protein
MRVLVPLPDRDFDVTEVAVPWRVLHDAGHQVVFATEQAGTLPAADPRLLDGVLFGQLGAAAEAKSYYAGLTRDAEFTATLAWAELDPAAFDGLLLPGGHAPGMRQYLGSAVLRPTTRRPSSCRTATTCPRAGRVTPTCSPAASATSCNPQPSPPDPPASRPAWQPTATSTARLMTTRT